MMRLELPLHYVSTVDCEDLTLLRQKAKVEACELLSHDSVRTSLLSRDKAHVPQLPFFASVGHEVTHCTTHDVLQRR